ncbi:cysteine protease [Algoriphagus halophytocola]|uniref:cysteine protease n=1 Tax=Algoriphagus halophytocola TaxID=2991499 RepID=UPI0022DD1071|nr:cysteine protease [Algoriphagus sp. TR-M9]WBL44949.1 cysteine protease [Algoriphagus sp. TR-M9]
MTRQLPWIFILSLFTIACSSSPSESENDEGVRLDEFIIEEMEGELQVLSDEIILLKDHFEFLLANRDSLLPYANKTKYELVDGFSVNTPSSDSTLSSVVIMESTPDYERALENVHLTNAMDSAFYNIYHRYDILAQAYFNTADQMSRVFPAYDAKTLLEPDLDLSNFNFYYEADEKHNPSRGPVWIPEVYIDPAGRGWILSLVQPVYDGDELYAVIGLDITVDDIINHFFYQDETDFLIVNYKGDIVGGNASAIEALSFPPLLNHVYRESIRADNFRISDYNLFNSKNREVREMAKAFILEKKSKFEFEDTFSPEVAYSVPFNLLDWYLLEIKSKP